MPSWKTKFFGNIEYVTYKEVFKNPKSRPTVAFISIPKKVQK